MGHSYGGVVITEAGVDPKVAGLVYVAAFAPDAGESALSLTRTGPATPIGADLVPDATGFLKLSDAGVAADFAQDLSPAEQSGGLRRRRDLSRPERVQRERDACCLEECSCVGTLLQPMIEPSADGRWRPWQSV